ncbi:MAG: hypothetical protein ACI4RD_10480 [Kiritimatiellia bacterium]
MFVRDCAKVLGTGTVLLCTAAGAADLFVSADGTWTMPGKTGVCYGDDRDNNLSALQAAINAAKHLVDTVWVKNDYVCDFGVTSSAINGVSSNCRILMLNKTITVRGEDDDWRNGPIIYGAWDASSDTGLGEGSIRALHMRRFCTIIGFQLLDGSCAVDNSDGNDGGGCVMLEAPGGSTPLMRHCLIAGGKAVRGGGVYSGWLESCVISNNVAVKSGGGTFYSSLEGCTVCENTVNSGGDGWGGGGSTGQLKNGVLLQAATNCVFYGNRAPASNAPGGGAYRMNLVASRFEANLAGGYGGGASDCISYNCSFLRNQRPDDGAYGRGGGAVKGGVHYNALMAWNVSSAHGGAVYNADLWNCTIYGNTNSLERGTLPGGCDVGTFVNCISSGNAGSDDSVTAATNSCLQVAALDADKHVDCVKSNPRFANPAAGDFRPKSRWCRDSALTLAWMLDPADVRSKDLADGPRIIGVAPDMGCYETKALGATLSFR